MEYQSKKIITFYKLELLKNTYLIILNYRSDSNRMSRKSIMSDTRVSIDLLEELRRIDVMLSLMHISLKK